MSSSPAAAAAVASPAAVMDDDVARIYAIVGKLQSASGDAEQLAQESATYEELLNAVKGSDSVKQLAADYIPQFLHLFPALLERGINAQLDLIEDDKSTIRIHAIRGLEHLARNSPSTVGRIADVLAQLLVASEPLEVTVVKATFAALFGIDAQAAFLALIGQIGTADAALPLRKSVLEFLSAQLKQQSGTLKKKDAAMAAAVGDGIKELLSSAPNTLQLARDELRFLVQQVILLSEHGNAPAKIAKDEALKAQLAAIVAAQAGVQAGGASLDVSNEAAVSHFLDVHSVASVLAAQYGVDASPFVDALLGQLLPSLDQLATPQLRTQVLRAIVAAASKLTPKQAQQHFAAFWNVFTAVLPNGEVKAKPSAAASGDAAPAAAAAGSDASSADGSSSSSAAAAAPALDFSTAEVLLALFHLLAPLAPSALKTLAGVFEPTGQPGESLSDPNPKRDAFFNRVDFAQQCNHEYKASLRAVERSLHEQLKSTSKKLNALRLKAEGKEPKAPSALTAGQPVGPEKVSLTPAAPAPPEPTEDELKASMKEAREQLQSAQAAMRLSASVSALAKPLQHRPLPKFLPAGELSLSWKRGGSGSGAKAGADAGKQQEGGNKGRGEKRKQGGEQQQGKQPAASKKQKGGQQQAASSSSQQQAGQKRKSSGGNAQQSQQSQQQQGQQKKQKQSASNKGGQQQQAQAQSSEGGRRRRRGGRR